MHRTPSPLVNVALTDEAGAAKRLVPNCRVFASYRIPPRNLTSSDQKCSKKYDTYHVSRCNISESDKDDQLFRELENRNKKVVIVGLYIREEKLLWWKIFVKYIIFWNLKYDTQFNFLGYINIIFCKHNFSRHFCRIKIWN